MNFYDLVSRTEDEVLQEILGSSVIRLLGLLDPILIRPTQLKQILLGLYTPQELLLCKSYRNLLLDLLRPHEARILATILEVNGGDYFQALKNMNIRRGSDRERALLQFFETALTEAKNLEVPLQVEIYSPLYQLFSHQRKAISKVKALLSSEPKRVLLHMPTGSGKTRTAMNVIAEHLRNIEPTIVVWLAYSEELCEQAINEFQKAWQHLGNRDVNIYRFWGNHEVDVEQIQDGFLVAGLSKVYSRLKNSISFINRIGSRASLVVIDEAHQAVAETYKLVLDVLVLPYASTGLLGLTATPGRTWNDVNADAELADFFSQRKVTLEISGYNSPVDYLVEQGYLAKVEYRTLLYESGIAITDQDRQKIRSELEIPQSLLDRLAEDEQRNLRILLEIEELSLRHQRIIVFSISVEHAKLINAVLRARGLTSDVVTGNTSSQDRERIIYNFKDHDPKTKILCNYGVLTTGFDAPRTSAAVISRPTKSLVLYSQMVGRVIRGVRAGGNKMAEVVTVIDSNLPGFESVASAFRNWEDVWRNDHD